MTALLPIGLHRGLSYEDYDRDPGIRATRLKDFDRSDQHAYHARQFAKESSALIVGNAVHTYALERELFDARYAVAPKVDRRTKKGKEEWAEFSLKAGGRIALTEQEHFQVRGMGESLLAHPDARSILLESEGLTEVTAIWNDLADSGIPRRGKARLDRLCQWNGYPTIADLKTTTDAHPDRWSREIIKWGYHVQMAWYSRGLQSLAPAARQCVHVVVEKTGCFATAVYPLDEEFVALGAKVAQDRFKRLCAAEKSGVWKGYKTQTVYAPEWLVRQTMQDEDGDY